MPAHQSAWKQDWVKTIFYTQEISISTYIYISIPKKTDILDSLE